MPAITHLVLLSLSLSQSIVPGPTHYLSSAACMRLPINKNQPSDSDSGRWKKSIIIPLVAWIGVR